MSDNDSNWLPQGIPEPPTVEIDRQTLSEALILLEQPNRKGPIAEEMRTRTITALRTALQGWRPRAGGHSTP